MSCLDIDFCMVPILVTYYNNTVSNMVVFKYCDKRDTRFNVVVECAFKIIAV